MSSGWSTKAFLGPLIRASTHPKDRSTAATLTHGNNTKGRKHRTAQAQAQSTTLYLQVVGDHACLRQHPMTQNTTPGFDHIKKLERARTLLYWRISCTDQPVYSQVCTNPEHSVPADLAGALSAKTRQASRAPRCSPRSPPSLR